ncbi:hypothetical protein ABG067_008955 [Albugo candida]
MVVDLTLDDSAQEDSAQEDLALEDSAEEESSEEEFFPGFSFARAQEESSEEEFSPAPTPVPARTPTPAPEEVTIDDELRPSRVGLPVPRDFTRDHDYYFARRVYFRMPSAQDLYGNQMSSKHAANR